MSYLAIDNVELIHWCHCGIAARLANATHTRPCAKSERYPCLRRHAVSASLEMILVRLMAMPGFPAEGAAETPSLMQTKNDNFVIARSKTPCQKTTSACYAAMSLSRYSVRHDVHCLDADFEIENPLAVWKHIESACTINSTIIYARQNLVSTLSSNIMILYLPCFVSKVSSTSVPPITPH